MRAGEVTSEECIALVRGGVCKDSHRHVRAGEVVLTWFVAACACTPPRSGSWWSAQGIHTATYTGWRGMNRSGSRRSAQGRHTAICGLARFDLVRGGVRVHTANLAPCGLVGDRLLARSFQGVAP